MLTEGTVKIELTPAEALVLSDFLDRFNKHTSYPFEDQAEQRVLWDVDSILEQQLLELFDPNYRKHLSEARNLVRDKES